ncbi:MAG: hypothetical protein AABY22_11955 [Nanoarchaeota archaeon]
MLRVTIELISAVDGHQEVLGVGYIGNDGTGSPTIGNYNSYFLKKGRSKIKKASDIWRQGRVEKFPRQRLNAWNLLYRALHIALNKEDK